jgi:hypothetical protein
MRAPVQPRPPSSSASAPQPGAAARPHPTGASDATTPIRGAAPNSNTPSPIGRTSSPASGSQPTSLPGRAGLSRSWSATTAGYSHDGSPSRELPEGDETRRILDYIGNVGTLEDDRDFFREQAEGLDAGGASPPREGDTEQEQQQLTDKGDVDPPEWVFYKTKPKRTACAAPQTAAIEALVQALVSGEGLDRFVRAVYTDKRKKALHEPPTAAEETLARDYREWLRRWALPALKAMREAEPGKRPSHYAQCPHSPHNLPHLCLPCLSRCTVQAKCRTRVLLRGH